MKSFPKVAALLLAGVFSLWAATPTGKWSASMPGRNGDAMTVTFNLKTEGDKLTGTVSGFRGETPISDGKVDGETIAFTVIREFNGNQLKQNYKGVVEGDTIHFTVSREGGRGTGGERKFDARKD